MAAAGCIAVRFVAKLIIVIRIETALAIAGTKRTFVLAAPPWLGTQRNDTKLNAPRAQVTPAMLAVTESTIASGPFATDGSSGTYRAIGDVHVRGQ